MARAAVAALTALVVGGAAGWAWQQSSAGPVRVSDVTGSLAVTVPEAWTAEVRAGGWVPPGQVESQPSLSAGTGVGWNEDGEGQGVFVGVLVSEDLPEQLPGHPSCASVLDPVADAVGEDPVLTQVGTDCPGVVVERVRRVATNRYVWIQVRSADRATANDVLDQVDVSGY